MATNGKAERDTVAEARALGFEVDDVDDAPELGGQTLDASGPQLEQVAEAVDVAGMRQVVDQSDAEIFAGLDASLREMDERVTAVVFVQEAGDLRLTYRVERGED